MKGLLVAIFISPTAGEIPHEVRTARALAGKGLEGDRYAQGNGTFSKNAGQRDVTLIESEALELFARETDHRLEAASTRRNLLTRGIRLNDLVGQEFVVGRIPMRGLRLCEPCAHLARVTSAPVFPGLIRRGGLYAQILEDGELAVGDVISVSAPA